MVKSPAKCEWQTLRDALTAFADPPGAHQSAAHIKPLHWYLACRMVIEGGFLPDDVTPRPPFVAKKRAGFWVLEHDRDSAGSGERNVLGGLKTKQVDVTVCKDGVGPVLAISMKGTLNAFRNLTNRMEEAVGDCTNLHIAYPALVYGFLHVMRANKEGPRTSANDVAIRADGTASDSIMRYHDVMSRLAGRNDVRDDTTKYESVGLALVVPDKPHVGELLRGFPPSESPLTIDGFFSRLYDQYDRRFVYAAPAIETTTRRVEWKLGGSIRHDERLSGFSPRATED